MLHKLIPAYKSYPWGGSRLKEEFGKLCDEHVLAESWELSCHKDGLTLLEKSGITLSQYIEEHPTVIGTVNCLFSEFPIMVKLIDAAKDLSVQVHPDDIYSRQHEGQAGKTEMWYVIDCTPGAYLYCGFSKDVTSEEIEFAIANNTLCTMLNRVNVKKGNVFLIEAGTIHAIGGGCLIAEVQQNSNVTYRIYDYGRTGKDGKPRELHIEKALEVANLKKATGQFVSTDHLVQCKYFTVDLITVTETQNIFVDAKSFRHLLVTEGTLDIRCQANCLQTKKGESVFIDAGTGDVSLTGNGTVLVTYIER